MHDEKWRTGFAHLLNPLFECFVNSKNIQLFTFSSTDSDSSNRSSRSLSIERNSNAGGKEMRMNYGHMKSCLAHQRTDSPSDNIQIKQMKKVLISITIRFIYIDSFVFR